MTFMHRHDPKVAELSRIPLFDNLPRREVALIAANLDEVTIPEGQELIREGEHNDAFWILLEGEAEMFVAGQFKRTIGPGKFFGATSMLDGKAAVATVRTRTRLRALVASAAQFRALQANQTIALRLMSYALERMREDLEAQTQQEPAGG